MKLLPMSAIYGANASGKSTPVKAIERSPNGTKIGEALKKH